MPIDKTGGSRYVIALDMEWNQPVPWKTYPGVPKALMPGEIIQIGAVKLDPSGRVVDELRLSVRPRYFKQVHWKVKKLTHISEADMLGGMRFPEAAARLGAWLRAGGTDLRFDMFAWGGEDERILIANLEAWGMDPEWLPDDIYDLRLIYDSFQGRTENSTSLTDAAAQEGVALDMDQHDSLNDARYAAAICAAIDLKRGIAEYEELGGAPAPAPAGQRLRVYGLAEPPAGLKDEGLNRFQCPLCGESLRCRDWVPQNKDRQIALVSCSQGHQSFLRTRFTRRPDGSYTALRTVYPSDEAAAAFYKKKQLRLLEAQRRIRRAAEKKAAAQQAERAAEEGDE